MIAKAGTGSDFGGLAQYLATGSKRNAPERVAWVEGRNLPTTDPKLVPAIMAATAAQSLRVQKPVYHLSISWPEEDGVDPTTMAGVAERTLRDIGLGDHQAVIVAHNDTAHPHLHIMVNRVHPETGKAWSNSLDYRRIETSLREQEHELALREVPGRHTDLDQGRQMRKRPSRTERARLRRLGEPERLLFSTEEMAGVRVTIGEALSTAGDWRELTNLLAEDGYTLQPKGQGLVIAKGDGYAKLSQVTPRTARLRVLEDRYGECFSDFFARAAQEVDHTTTTVEALEDDDEKEGLRRKRRNPLNLDAAEIEAELLRRREARRREPPRAPPDKDRER